MAASRLPTRVQDSSTSQSAIPAGAQHPDPVGVGHPGVHAEQLAENAPEQVARVRVVLPRAQRGHPGHAAENQAGGVAVRDGGEAADAGHG